MRVTRAHELQGRPGGSKGPGSLPRGAAYMLSNHPMRLYLFAKPDTISPERTMRSASASCSKTAFTTCTARVVTNGLGVNGPPKHSPRHSSRNVPRDYLSDGSALHPALQAAHLQRPLIFGPCFAEMQVRQLHNLEGAIRLEAERSLSTDCREQQQAVQTEVPYDAHRPAIRRNTQRRSACGNE